MGAASALRIGGKWASMIDLLRAILAGSNGIYKGKAKRAVAGNTQVVDLQQLAAMRNITASAQWTFGLRTGVGENRFGRFGLCRLGRLVRRLAGHRRLFRWFSPRQLDAHLVPPGTFRAVKRLVSPCQD
jgi:hypothetical protein